MATRQYTLTETDKKALAVLYCLYGHERFVWVNKGKFQYYFGVTYRSKNRLVKMGLLDEVEMQYAPHWLAFRSICRISPTVRFDDSQITKAINEARAELVAKGYDYTPYCKPYKINNPEYTFKEFGINPDFATLVESLPKQSKYLIGDDTEHIRFVARYWPNEAVEAATQSITTN